VSEEESSDFENNSDGSEAKGKGDGKERELNIGDFVPHAYYYYRQHIDEGFERRAPPKCAFSKSF
jgi:hypothetical protein